MKSLFVVLVALFPLLSFADPVLTGWYEVSMTGDHAGSSQEFVRLQQEYPQYFGGFNAIDVSSADITMVTYQFRGQTTCSANDPRLTFVGASYNVCYAAVDGCSTTMYTMPSPNDPCAQ